MKTTMRWVAVALAAASAAAPAWALYKVVGPDGKVTYTDRPPAEAQGRPVPRSGDGSAAGPADDTAMPYALRTVAAKFPVTLYTVDACDPCARARDLLKSRGIPFRERTASTDADREAWHRQFSGSQAPVLTIGSQRLEGLQVERWHGYLDAAGYPRESALPPGWRHAAAQPLAPRPAPAAAAPRAPEPPAAPATPPEPPPAPGGFRF